MIGEAPVLIDEFILYALPFTSEGCRCVLVDDFLGGFEICVADNPLTGYLDLFEEVLLLFVLLERFFDDVAAPTVAAAVAFEAVALAVEVSTGCFGNTNAFVCFRR